ncbi:hypothetical protein NL676_014548 [Syzygium grande]|nr:hypothetical protein NL676_014548 [Syzygium grande]
MVSLPVGNYLDEAQVIASWSDRKLEATGSSWVPCGVSKDWSFGSWRAVVTYAFIVEVGFGCEWDLNGKMMMAIQFVRWVWCKVGGSLLGTRVLLVGAGIGREADAFFPD